MKDDTTALLLQQMLEEFRKNHDEVMDEVTEIKETVDNIDSLKIDDIWRQVERINWLEDKLDDLIKTKSLDDLIFKAIVEGKKLPNLEDPTFYGLPEKDE